MDALLMLEMDIQPPRRADLALDAGAGLQRVRRVIVGVNNGALIARSKHGSHRSVVHGAEGVHPAVLREVVVVDAHARAPYCRAAISGGVGNTEPRSNRAAVIVRNARSKRNSQGTERDRRRVLFLSAAGSAEKAKGGVVAQAEVQRETGTHAPGILRVKPQAAQTLREGAVLSGKVGLSHVHGGRRVGHIKTWVVAEDK